MRRKRSDWEKFEDGLETGRVELRKQLGLPPYVPQRPVAPPGGSGIGTDDRLDRPDGRYRRDMDFARCLNGWRNMIELPPKDDWYRPDRPHVVNGGDVQSIPYDEGTR